MDVTITATGAGGVDLRPTDRPPTGAGELAGTTIVSLVSPGTELATIHLDDAAVRPAALGYAAVFRVEEVGGAVSGFGPGDLVMSMGPHASWQRQSADRVLLLPDGLAPERAVFSRMINVSLSGIVTSPLRAGLQPAVIGLGLVGQLAVRALAAQGYRPIAVDESPERRALLPSGADARDRLDDESADVVLECSGSEDNVSQALRGLRTGGEVVLCGLAWRQRSEAPAFELLSTAFRKFATIRSGWEWQLPWRNLDKQVRPDLSSTLRQALHWLAAGAIRVEGLATTVVPADAPAAYARLKDRTADRLSILIDWTGERADG